MENKELFQKVKSLNLPVGKYALFGSAPMGIKGLKNCRDMDIIVTEELFKELLRKYKSVSEKGGIFLEKENIEIFKDWGPGSWDINELIKEAEIIDGLPFVKLEEVVKWKKIRSKEKDLKDIGIIEKYLAEK